MSTKPHSTSFSVGRFHFSVRLGSLFFPLSLDDIKPGLDILGYSMTPALDRTRLPYAPGVRLSISGQIAENLEAKLSLRMDPERGIVAIEGSDIEAVIKSFDELEKWVQENTSVDFAQERRFYEFIFDGTISVGSERDPIRTISNLYSDSRTIEQFGDIIEAKVTNFGIRLVQKDRSPGEDEWLDIRVEPTVERPRSTYLANVVYRSPDKEKVIARANELLATLEQIIATIESSN